MHRRDFLRSAGTATAGLAWPGGLSALANPSRSDGWRTFEVLWPLPALSTQGQGGRMFGTKRGK
jgi:hypothetical protein